jgi:diketogulonate reductase-like aldo/keto reductase
LTPELTILIDYHLDYGNEKSVGTAIRESGLHREELYITSKYSGGKIQESVRASLDKVHNST